MKRRTFVKSAVATPVATSLPFNQATAYDQYSYRRFIPDLPAKNLEGEATVISRDAIKALKKSLRGPLIVPDSAAYEKARKVFNGMVNSRPAMIVRPQGVADVVTAVNFARENNLLAAVRGGGHSYSGKSATEGSFVIDCTLMRGIRVDPADETVDVQPGVLLGEMDRETQAFGYIVPSGTVSHTGVAGLTLGGGVGRLMRKFGLTVDSLIELDVVTADGRFLKAATRQNPDLYWGCRGGGGNFGVVTNFKYKMHKFGPVVLAGSITYAWKDVRKALTFFHDFSQALPRDASFFEARFFHLKSGEKALDISVCYVGDMNKGEKLLKPLRKFGRPLLDTIGPVDWLNVQQFDNQWNPPGHFYYVKNGFSTELEEEVFEILIDGYENSSSPLTVIHLNRVDGAMADVDPSATAFFHRSIAYSLMINTVWKNPNEIDKHRQWTRTFFSRTEPYVSGTYLNRLAGEDEQGDKALNRIWGEHLQRLVTVKNKYDPHNMFRLNANIKPSI